jgi:hypothetical protein
MIDDEDEQDAEEVVEGQPDNAASPKAFRRKRLDKEWFEREEAAYWRRSLADPIGRHVLWNLFIEGGAFDANHAVGPTGFPDPLATEYYRGRTLFTWALYQKLAALDRTSILLMHDEHDHRFPKPKRERAPAKPRVKHG